MLAKAGMKKINFSGGEPFLIQGGKYLGEMVRYCKEELDIQSVTVVSNGSKVTESWMAEYGYYLDIMAVSVDSFDQEVNEKIGRRSGSRSSHLLSLQAVRSWCREFSVLFKLNTVVNKHNYREDMTEQIRSVHHHHHHHHHHLSYHARRLDPVRWKVFQCLPIEAENMGPGALRQVEPFLVTEEEWQTFITNHHDITVMVQESNEKMRNSYLILDEYMRFLDNTEGKKEPSKSILDVGVQAAINKAGFDEAMFLERGGKYQWSKSDNVLDNW